MSSPRLSNQSLQWTRPLLDELCDEVRLSVERFGDEEIDSRPEDLDEAIAACDKVAGSLAIMEFSSGQLIAEAMRMALEALKNGQARDRDLAINTLLEATGILPDYLDYLETTQRDAPIVVLPTINDLRSAAGEKALDESSFFRPEVGAVALPALPAEAGPDVAEIRRRYQHALRGMLLDGEDAEAQGRLAEVALAVRDQAELPEPVRRAGWGAAAVCEALRQQHIAPTPATTRLFARLDVLLKNASESAEDPSLADRADDLTRGFLFQVAMARSDGPLATEVNQAFDLAGHAPDQVAQAKVFLAGRNRALFAAVTKAAREDLARIKDALGSQLESGADPAVLGQQTAMLQSVGESLSMLGLDHMARRVTAQAGKLAEMGTDPNDPSLLMVARELLVVESQLEDSFGLASDLEADEALQDAHTLLPPSEQRRVTRQLVKEALEDLAHAKHLLDAVNRQKADAGAVAEAQSILGRISGALAMAELVEVSAMLDAASLLAADHLGDGARGHPDALDTLAETLTVTEFYLESLTTRDERGERYLLSARGRLQGLGYLPEPAEAAVDAATLPDAPIEIEADELTEAESPVSFDEMEDMEEGEPAMEFEIDEASESILAEGDDEEELDLGDLDLDEPEAAPDETPRALDEEDEEVLADEPGAGPDLDAEGAAVDLAGLDELDLEEEDGEDLDDLDLDFETGEDEAAFEAEAEADSVSDLRPAESAESSDENTAADAPAKSAGGTEAGGFGSAFDDFDIVEIFLEEFDQELESLGELVPSWQQDPGDEETTLTIRRAFHSLKGSGRMAGAVEIGEFAWQIENMLNRVLDRQIEARPEITGLVAEAVRYLPSMRARLSGDGPGEFDQAACEALAHRAELASAGQLAAAAPARVQPPELEDLDPTLIELMIKELSENLEVFDQWLQDADDSGHVPVADERLVRVVHTMKGTMRLAPIGDETETAQILESYLEELSLCVAPPSRAGLLAMARCSDLFSLRLDRLRCEPVDDEVFQSESLARELRELHHQAHRERTGDQAIAEQAEEAAAEDGFPIGSVSTEEEALVDEDDFDAFSSDAELEMESEAEASDVFGLDEDDAAVEVEKAGEEDLPLAADTESAEDDGADEDLVSATDSELGEPVSPDAEDEVLATSEEPTEEPAQGTADELSADEDERDRSIESDEAESDARRPFVSADEFAELDDTVSEPEVSPSEAVFSDQGEEPDSGLEAIGDEAEEEAEAEADFEAETGFGAEADLEAEAGDEEALEAEIEAEAELDVDVDADVSAAGSSDQESAERSDSDYLSHFVPDRPETGQTLPEPAGGDDDDTNLVKVDYSEVNEDLLEAFLEEGQELLEHADDVLQKWREAPDDKSLVTALQRDLHTIKGSARMVGLNPIGQVAHVMEEMLEGIAAGLKDPTGDRIDALEAGCDHLHSMIDAVVKREAVPMRSLSDLFAEQAEDLEEAVALPELTEQIGRTETAAVEEDSSTARAETLRVPSSLIDELVNYAGEISIFRSRLEQQISVFRSNVGEVDETVIRLRDQLRKLEIETEAQILARYEREHGPADEAFDPLELDRYSTIQQLSRALAESVNDLTSLTGILDDATRQSETLLMQQSRVNTELQEGLMQARMVSFNTLLPRFRRVVRNSARELEKKVQLRVNVSGEGELDRNVLDRITAPMEHLLRNAVSHGIEGPALRRERDKPETGTITIEVGREATELVMRVSDDGGGLNLEAIRRRALERGLLDPSSEAGDAELTQMIFRSGFSTAEQVSEISGRGIGMDVVANEVRQIGGSVSAQSKTGQGALFTIRIPLSLTVMQAIMVRAADRQFAIPLQAVRGVTRVLADEWLREIETPEPTQEYAGEQYPLLELEPQLDMSAEEVGGGTLSLLMIEAGEQRAALRVAELMGHREIVIKPVGPQISSIPGILGGTITGDGQVVPILDMGPLIRRAFDRDILPGRGTVLTEKTQELKRTPLVMVVDDSITMRRVTSRVLEHRGLEVVTARDGLDAVEAMFERVPDLILLDIEMPRMDGYELAIHVRNDPRLKEVPMMMITSRSGEKHRQRAREVGVNDYLAKPYQETDLVQHVFDLLEMPVPEG
ncbi:MAG: Hpt domain-containing protein [Wenzhouxiangella sp.]|nr:Hpt domain-containing protein [Wenzhouxiangella sp.]